MNKIQVIFLLLTAGLHNLKAQNTTTTPEDKVAVTENMNQNEGRITTTKSYVITTQVSSTVPGIGTTSFSSAEISTEPFYVSTDGISSIAYNTVEETTLPTLTSGGMDFSLSTTNSPTVASVLETTTESRTRISPIMKNNNTSNSLTVKEITTQDTSTTLLVLEELSQNSSTIPPEEIATQDSSTIPPGEITTQNSSTEPPGEITTQNSSTVPPGEITTQDSSTVPPGEITTQDSSTILPVFEEMTTRYSSTVLPIVEEVTTQNPSTISYVAEDITTQYVDLTTEYISTTQPITLPPNSIETTTSVAETTTPQPLESTTAAQLEKDPRRPLYVVGHMTNSLDEIKYMLDRGANSIEFDLNFDRSGNPTYVFHGYLCDIGRICDRSEKVDIFLGTLANMSTPSHVKYRRRLVLLNFDLKLYNLDTGHMEIAGENLANKIVHHMNWHKDTQARDMSVVKVLLNIEYPTFHPVFFGLKREFQRLLDDDFYYKYVGWSFGGDGFTESTATAVWRSVGIDRNIWRGYGAPNMFAFLVGDGILEDAICNREQSSIPAKVARWTIDNPLDIRNLLRKSVDVIVTNFPQVPMRVLREEEFRHVYRLATIEDDPWEKFVDPNSVSKLCKKGLLKFFSDITREISDILEVR